MHKYIHNVTKVMCALYVRCTLSVGKYGILFDGENISFDASLVVYINSTNIPPFMIINRIYETQNLLSP